MSQVATEAEFRRRVVANVVALASKTSTNFGRTVTTRQPTGVAALTYGADTHWRVLHRRLCVRRPCQLDGLSGCGTCGRQHFAPLLRFELLLSIAPSVPVILLMLFPAILMAVRISCAPEVGTITNFYGTPPANWNSCWANSFPRLRTH